MTKQIILIGGMPAAGKSTLAKNLSKHLNLPWISTDQIGILMRAVADREKYPRLFTWDNYADGKVLNELPTDEIADREFAKSEETWLGVRKFINEDFTWSDGFIIEGDDILPHLVYGDFSGFNNVKALFIGDSDIERVRKVVFARDISWDKEKEVEWNLNFNEKLKSQVRIHNMHWVEVEKNENDLAKALNALELG